MNNSENISDIEKHSYFHCPDKTNQKENSVIEDSLEFDTLAVIIKTKQGKYFQLALNQIMCETLVLDLKNYYNGGIIQIMPNEINGIEFYIQD